MTRKMKDSGIEWIGEIPEDWEISKIKYVSDLNGRIGFRGYKQSDLVEEEHGAITLGPPNMDNGKLNLLNCKYLSWEKYYESPEIQLRVGDILLVKTASVGKVAYVDRLVKEMTINPQLLIIKSKNINNKFLFYVIFSEFFQSQVEMSVTGGTVPTLSQEKISNFEITNPPMTSQIKIAKYLDKMCFEVERISNKIKLEIENLENYKKSVITETVTKGLDKNVEIKDSGIEWIGEIPKHWEVVKIKYIPKKDDINSFIDGDWIESNYIKEDGIRYITTGNIGDGKFIVQGNGFISRKDFELLRCKYAYPGDLIFSRLNAPYGRSCLLPDTYSEYVIAVDNVILRPDEYYNRKFINYLTQCIGYQQSVKDSASGTTMQRISRTKLGDIPLPFPNTEEQNDIVEYLDKKTKLIDDSIALKQKQLETLEEYKKSLIYEYVTGKKEVNDGEET